MPRLPARPRRWCCCIAAMSTSAGDASAEELDMPDAQFFAWDARGNGRSPGVRGDAPGFEALVRDLDGFIAHLGATHGIAVQDMVVIAQSVGAVVAATWVHDYAPPLRALVLASPAFKVTL
ncbi:alpha/beta hydrolase, partial [Xanthomonas oryzae pv. oryzae]